LEKAINVAAISQAESKRLEDLLKNNQPKTTNLKGD
jgi:hypothetical protein